ncbi:MAG TPA: UDP-N-acetylmuramoyl-tripeptide--D-alanyl-D-alanine ligase [Deltaproteobacteria bacterium]|nr:UDP-N-acetylmuramoyl-tripeptide--D-alanyl-D-alanine ligase [Deltaproteobacteria bacterium]
MKYQARQIASATRGYIISGDPHTWISGISTDTRTIKEGDLFIALRGENFDGQDFIEKAFAKGACGAVVMDEEIRFPGMIIFADDTLVALGDIAAFIRNRYSPSIVGITGSTGKTTVKEFCASILSLQGPCLKTMNNFNNLIGVPLSLIELGNHHEFAVIEMGTNRFGEIDRLSTITRPTVSVLTNINPVHLKGLRTISGIIREKQSVFKNTTIPGTAVLNPYQEYMDRVSIAEHLSRKTYSMKDKADITLKKIDYEGLDGSDIIIDIAGTALQVHVPLPGRHNISNALAAAACACALDIDPEKIAQGIKDAQLPGMRSEIIFSGRITIINDCYNANPASMKAALEMLSSSPHVYKVAVLGDMLELGNHAEHWHKELGKWVAQSGISRLIVIGEMAHFIADATVKSGMNAAAVHIAPDMEDIFWNLSDMADKDAIVLVKASRALRLDLVVNHLKAVA